MTEKEQVVKNLGIALIRAAEKHEKACREYALVSRNPDELQRNQAAGKVFEASKNLREAMAHLQRRIDDAF